MRPQALPGFRDFYPDDAALRNHIFAVWRDVAARYGFVEYDGPPLEPLELYTAKSGEEIVGQLYTFEDRGGRAVALRPEMTPSLARMVAAQARRLKKPIRWFSVPQLFRYERQQRGRLREHFQLNMDLIGEPGPLAEAEIIAAGLDVLRALGLGAEDVCARVSDRRVMQALLEARGLDERQIETAYAHIDKLGRESKEALVPRFAGAAGLDAPVAEEVLALGEVRELAAVEAVLEKATRETARAEPLRRCVEALQAMGLGDFVRVDLGIVRGLAYYTGIVFELFDVRGEFRAVCGGGRYDGLLKALGGIDLPAVGFGMGDVVLTELLRRRCLAPTSGAGLDVFFVAVTVEDMPLVLELTHQLRERHLRVEFPLRQQSVTKQLKLAAAREARWAVLVAPDERATGEVVMRDLTTGEERRVPIARLAEEAKPAERGTAGGE